MPSVIVDVVKVRADARVPARGTSGAAGHDIYLSLPDGMESVRIMPSETRAVPTGVSLRMPEYMEAQVRGRSSMSLRGLVCHLGTIDPDYSGEVSVILTNTSSRPIRLVRGDRIAQLVFSRILPVKLEGADQLPPPRTGGFGSTGR